MNTQNGDWVSLEELLGPSADRYLSSGYKGVVYELDRGANTSLGWLGRVRYPADWSRRRHGQRRGPHLSSIDAAVLPLLALETLCSEVDGAQERLPGHWLSSLSLRSLGPPWLDTSSVPVSLDGSSWPFHPANQVNTVRARVGNIGVAVTLECAGTSVKLGPRSGPSVFGGAYKQSHWQSHVAGRAAAPGVFSSRHRMSVASSGDELPRPGIEGDFWPAANILDYVSLLGQLGHVVAGPKVQHREDNLWLRSLNVEIPDPPGVREFGIESRLTRENVVERAGVRIHDLHMEAVATHGVRVRGKLAYREGAGDIPIELTEGSVVGARPNIRLKGVR